MINKNLFEAVESGSVEKVKQALSKEKVNTTTYYGAKSIILATENGEIEIIKILLKSSVKIPRASFWTNCYNVALLSLSKAAQNGSTEILKLLLDYGASVEKKDLRIAFIEAILNRNLEMTKMLLDAGVNVNIKDDNGFTPLMCAILLPFENQDVLVEWLLKAGAHVNVKRKYWTREERNQVWKVSTALTYAEELGSTQIVEMLKNVKDYRSLKEV
jgi:FOG: Ankyrin repeat